MRIKNGGEVARKQAKVVVVDTKGKCLQPISNQCEAQCEPGTQADSDSDMDSHHSCAGDEV